MAAASPAAWLSTGQPTSNACCALPGSNRSAPDLAIPKRAGNLNAGTNPPRPGCACSHPRDHPKNCKTNSTVGARTITTPDHTKPSTARPPLNVGPRARQRFLVQPSLDQYAPACTASTKAGHIGWSDYVVGIDSRLAGQRVLVIARDFTLAIYGQQGLLRRLTIDTTRRYQPTGIPPGRRR